MNDVIFIIITISLIAIGLFSLLFAFLLSILNQKINVDRLSLSNEFPAEIFLKSSKKKLASVFYFVFICSFVTLAIIIPYKVTLLEVDPNLKYILIACAICIFLACTLSVFLLVVIPQFIQIHTKIYIGLSFFLTIACVLYAIVNFLLFRTFYEIKYIIFMSVFAFLALSCLWLVINPKIRKWTILEKKNTSEDEVVYVRPKVISLAISEWFISIIFLILLVTLGLFIIV